MRTEELFAFIFERWRIAVLKDSGAPRPWTADRVLQDYRFCNVYREWDTETKWIAENWRTPNLDDEHLWFAMLVARVINWSPTLEAIGYPVPWRAHAFIKTLRARKAAEQKVWTGAYMITTHKVPMPKIEYYANMVLSAAWQHRNVIKPTAGERLESFHVRLTKLRGISSFLAAQVIADLKYAPVLVEASDWWTWAAPGTGSIRGMNRVFDRPIKTRYGEGRFLCDLHDLMLELFPLMRDARMPFMHAQDLQNCLCEFDKYERVRLGQGVPRSRYDGRGEMICSD